MATETAPVLAKRAAAAPGRLSLGAIEVALRALQREFPRVNRELRPPRDVLDDEVVGNLLTAYRYLDELLAAGSDPFCMGKLANLLELNSRVLCGNDRQHRTHSRALIETTESRFYEQSGGGIGDVVEWYQRHRDESVWKRAAGVYVRVLSEPQLFVEGNHRTGALIVSYILAREGHPPFVLTAENIHGFFDPSTVIRHTKKNSLVALFELPQIRKRFARFLQEHANRIYLRDGAC
jgi:hypothetical protein